MEHYLRKLFQKNSLFRWLIPLSLTLVTFSFFKYKNQAMEIISVFTMQFFSLFLVFFMLTSVCWWIFLDGDRFRCLLDRMLKLRFPILSVSIFAIVIFPISHLFLGIKNNLFYFSLISISFTLFITMLIFSDKNPRLIAGNIILFISSTTFTIIAAEIFFRLILVEHKVPLTETGFNKWISSSWPRAIPSEKKPGIFRILGLGDSFGRASEHKNYHYLLENLLWSKDSTFEVVNISGEAYDLPDELAILKRFGGRYQPDLVIHGFFVGNDFWIPEGDLLSYKGITLRSGSGLNKYLPHNFLLLRWIYRYLKVINNRRQKENEMNQNKQTGTFHTAKYLEIERECLEIARVVPDPNKRWKRVTHFLDQIRTAVDRMNAKYLVVIHPDQFQVEDSLFHQIIQQYQLDPDNFDVDSPQKFLVNYCKSHNIPCIDLLPVFRNEGANGGLYRFRDSHYNDDGNRVAAKVIYDFIINSSLISK